MDTKIYVLPKRTPWSLSGELRSAESATVTECVFRKRVLICGARDYTSYQTIYNALKRERASIACVIEGECRGADRLGRVAAKLLGIPVMQFPARWNDLGAWAGPIRNGEMIEKGKPDEVWAFHDAIGESKGTANMIEQATDANLLIRLYSNGAVVTRKGSFQFATLIK